MQLRFFFVSISLSIKSGSRQWIIALKKKCGPAASERLYVTSLGEPQQEREDDCRGSERPKHLEGWELPL